MAASFISILGPDGVLRLTDSEFREAKNKGYDGPQDSTLLMLIGGQDEHLGEILDAYEGSGEFGDETDLSVQVESKVDKMKVPQLKEALKALKCTGYSAAN